MNDRNRNNIKKLGQGYMMQTSQKIPTSMRTEYPYKEDFGEYNQEVSTLANSIGKQSIGRDWATRPWGR